jgi:N-acetylglucosamine-6-phosphate deacetylase
LIRSYSGLDPATGRPLTVRVADGHIVDVSASTGKVEGWLAPGLVDLQVNGFAGFDVNGRDVTADTIVELGRALAAVGTTTFAPTVITAAEQAIVASLRAVAAARDADKATRDAIPFVHVEGPHLSPEDGPRGAHPLEHIRPPDVEEFDRWQRACGGLVGIVTLSPSTHLGNGAHAMLPRHQNHLWTQLADDRLTAGFIADGHHLPADALTAMVRAKGIERSLLVSDSVALAGSEPGEYETQADLVHFDWAPGDTTLRLRSVVRSGSEVSR